MNPVSQLRTKFAQIIHSDPIRKFYTGLLLSSVSISGCTLGVMDHPNQVHLSLDLNPAFVIKNSTPLSSASSIVAIPALTPPASWSNFTCLAVNVVGNGIPSASSLPTASTYLASMLGGGFCSYLGITSSPIPMGSATAAVDLTIPISVTSGLVQVLGVYDPKGIYCSQAGSLGSIYPMTSANVGNAILFELGRANVTLTSNTTTTVSDTYTSLSATDKLARQADCLNSLSTLLSNFSYSSSVVSNTIGIAMSSLTPTISGDSPTSYTISPSLPAGLTLDSLTGTISGTPTTLSSQTTYSVQATNAYGSATTSLSIQVSQAQVSATPPPTAPAGKWVDNSGNIYIADTKDHVVRKVNATNGVISTVAGTVLSGCTYIPCGDGGAATSAQLNAPLGLALDALGNIIIADTVNHVVRKVDATSGIITTIAGIMKSACSAAPCGDGGLATSAQLNLPAAIAIDTSGNIFIADYGDQVIRKIDATTSIITTVAGTMRSSCGASPCGAGGPATSAKLVAPMDVWVDTYGSLYIINYYGITLNKVDGTTGTFSTLAGTYGINCQTVPCGDGGAATSALFFYPAGIAVDSVGNIYVADTYSHTVRKININSGIINTIGGIMMSAGILGDGGPATSSKFNFPTNLSVDLNGNVYVADSANNSIRRIDATSGNMTTVAGTYAATGCITSPCGDGGPATSAKLNSPFGKWPY